MSDKEATEKQVKALLKAFKTSRGDLPRKIVISPLDDGTVTVTIKQMGWEREPEGYLCNL